jgi:hypothetical protein
MLFFFVFDLGIFKFFSEAVCPFPRLRPASRSFLERGYYVPVCSYGYVVSFMVGIKVCLVILPRYRDNLR